MAEPLQPDVYNHYLPLGWTNQQEPLPAPDITAWSTASFFSYSAQDGTNTESVKIGLTSLYLLVAFNSNANFIRYVRIFDTGLTPVVGVDTPVREIPIPAGGVLMVSSQGGETYTNGIGFTLTGGSGTTDTTPINAQEVYLFLGYL